MPSVPSYPAERESAQMPAPYRTYESFAWYEAATFSIPGGTVFAEAARFSGKPDSLLLIAGNANVDVRLRRRGGAAGSTIELATTQPTELKMGDEILEARDRTGAGGQGLIIVARFGSQQIDVRSNRPGPSRERPMLAAEELATQVPTSE